jgi:RNA polymerase sigma-70 factor (ECF subfamily)
MTTGDSSPTTEALLSQTAWIRALARSLVVDQATADDVAQDAVVVALTKPPSSAAALRAWLRRVVKNLASNARRGETRRGAREKSVAVGESDHASDEVVARWEVRRQVVEAVLSLDEPYRSTILLRFFDGLTAAQAAARLGVPFETVRTRTRRGLELLRVRLARLDDGEGRRGAAVLLLLARPDADLAAPGAALTGGVLMASTTKWAAAAAVLLLLAVGATWAVVMSHDARLPAPQPATPETAAAAPPKPHRATPAATAPSDVVDLAACDRERDLHGVVLDPDGRPVAGATVTARRKQPWGVTLRTHDETHMIHDAEATKSDINGAFALRLSAGDEVGLRADADGFAVWESESRQAGERVTIRLARGLTLDVVVKTHDGAQAADAPVRVSVEAARTDHVARYDRTDADGHARFARLPRGASASISVASNAAHQQTKLSDAESQTIVVTLPATRVVHGTVTDAATKVAIEGARVSVQYGLGHPVATDSLGRFEIAAFESRNLLAEAPGYARAEMKVEEGADVAFALERATRLTGRVVDAEGKPLKDADVSLIGNSDMGGRFDQSSAGGATTDAEGKFAVDGLLVGRLHLFRVHADGHALLYRQEYTATPDQPDRDLGDVVLAAPHMLHGVVIDAEGKPAVGSIVGLDGPDGTRDFVLHLHRLSDDLGRVAFPELPPGTYEVSTYSGSVKSTIEVTVPSTGDPPLVTLRTGIEPKRETPAIPVAVRVTDEDGKPVPDVRVCIGYAANGSTPWTAVGADGTLTLEADAFPATVSVSPPDRGDVRYLREFVWLRPGAREATVVLRRGAVISGRVVSESGGAVQSAWVEAFDGARQAAAASTDADGRFALVVPVGGRFDVQASLPHAINDSAPPKRSVAELHDVAAGPTDLVLKMVRTPPTHTVDVEVVDERGAAITGLVVRAEFVGHDQFKPLYGITGADGHARIDGLPRSSATFSVTITDPKQDARRSWGPLPRRVAGDVDSVRIVVGKPRTLHGRVVLEDGAPCASATVFVPGANCSGAADAEGRFSVDVPADLPAPYAVHGSPPPYDGKKPMSGYDLVDADERELTIVLHGVPAR